MLTNDQSSVRPVNLVCVLSLIGVLTTHSSAAWCNITPYYKSAQLSAQLLNHSDKTDKRLCHRVI